MMSSIKRISVFIPQGTRFAAMSQLGHLGSGAGRGGGGGGSIREAGGSFGRMEAAHEEEYFHKKQLQQLRDLKEEKISHKEFHEKQIKELEDAVQRHKDSLKQITEKE